ncbi:MAG: hypothetical protein AAF702_08735 [Chloroflexota bacterium]
MTEAKIEAKEPSVVQLDRATKSISGSLVVSAVRCTIQYILLPFVLPFLGLTGVVSAYIGIVLEVLAIGVILYNIVVLWPTSWRWRYLGIGSVMLFILGVFLYSDIQALM